MSILQELPLVQNNEQANNPEQSGRSVHDSEDKLFGFHNSLRQINQERDMHPADRLLAVSKLTWLALKKIDEMAKGEDMGYTFMTIHDVVSVQDLAVEQGLYREASQILGLLRRHIDKLPDNLAHIRAAIEISYEPAGSIRYARTLTQSLNQDREEAES